ncbi:hypothetical protein HPP92_005716 [Vanilla planifolia]|uniref:Uncharacterized protein n=1 Tax=Vanilla planifolia TaxID=51239 RepID=A0A835VDG4_VANPL|nr:hypothetical protein HPP92_005716 [Vanilla planifolia]
MPTFMFANEFSRSRRGKRFSQVVRRRCLFWIFLLFLLSLFHLAFVEPSLSFLGSRHEKASKIFMDEIKQRKSEDSNDHAVSNAIKNSGVPYVPDFHISSMHSNGTSGADTSHDISRFTVEFSPWKFES